MAIHSCPPHSSCSDACFWRSSKGQVPREHHWGCWRAASHWIKRTCVLDQTWIMHYFEWLLWTECIIHVRQPTMVLTLIMQRATHNDYWHCIDIYFPTSYRYHIYFLYEEHVYELVSTGNVNENILIQNSFCSCNNPIKWLMND